MYATAPKSAVLSLRPKAKNAIAAVRGRVLIRATPLPVPGWPVLGAIAAKRKKSAIGWNVKPRKCGANLKENAYASAREQDSVRPETCSLRNIPGMVNLCGMRTPAAVLVKEM